MPSKLLDTESTPELFPIRELSARTQVNTVTIRAWERRYGLLKPQRTAKGHRLYTDDDVRRVETILQLVGRGVPLSKIKALLDQGQGATEADQMTGDEIWLDQSEELQRHAKSFSSRRIEALLSEKLIQYPPSVCLEKLLKPALESLYTQDDHLAAWTFAENEILRYVLVRLSAKKSVKGKKPTITLSRGQKTDLWRMAIIALELADGDYQVQLLTQCLSEQTWLTMAQTSLALSPANIQVFYQDGFWKQETGEKIAAAIQKNKQLIACGTAPVVYGLKASEQIFTDLESYAAYQLKQ